MSNEELCFCGSGRRKIKCHPDIKEDSRGARVFSLYSKVDKAIEEHFNKTGTKPPCKVGCIDCCYDNFPISDVEFDIILLEIKKWSKEKIKELIERLGSTFIKMRSENPNYIASLEKDITGAGFKEVMDKDMRFTFVGKEFPCLFLDEKNKKCMIYQVRPMTCREYGVSYRETKGIDECDKPSAKSVLGFDINEDFSICNNIGNNYDARKWQADLSEFDDEIFTISRLPIGVDKNYISRRQYPIFYFLYMAFTKYESGFEITDFKGRFQTSETDYIKGQIARMNALKNR